MYVLAVLKMENSLISWAIISLSGSALFRDII
jgi:hypothetical protein